MNGRRAAARAGVWLIAGVALLAAAPLESIQVTPVVADGRVRIIFGADGLRR
jgi:hypothetical protein